MPKDVNVSLRNLGTVSKNLVTISTDKGSVRLWFSYSTLVGVDGRASKNEWSRTTEKLLKEIEPDKSKRFPHKEIEKLARKKLAFITG
jgi:hypothetical protein